MESIDQGALVVRLEEVDLQPELAGSPLDAGVDLVERLVAVDLRLARPHEVQVRSLEHQHARHPPAFAASIAVAASTTSSSGTSLRTSTPSAVGSTQRRRPPACFLSVARWRSTSSSG